MWPFGKKKENKIISSCGGYPVYRDRDEWNTYDVSFGWMHPSDAKSVIREEKHKADRYFRGLDKGNMFGDGVFPDLSACIQTGKYRKLNRSSGSYHPDWMNRYGVEVESDDRFSNMSDEDLCGFIQEITGIKLESEEKVTFTCGYCRTRFDKKDVDSTYNCPKCGAPITHYVKGF